MNFRASVRSSVVLAQSPRTAVKCAIASTAQFCFAQSTVPGYTRNPYALDRVPAGSSGGTAAAVAASFGAVGLGTDTGNSIRGPSSHPFNHGVDCECRVRLVSMRALSAAGSGFGRRRYDSPVASLAIWRAAALRGSRTFRFINGAQKPARSPVAIR
jgi:hypothetical protein